MPVHPTEQLRTVAFVGHTGVGKTSLVEAMLAAAGAIPAAGSIERGNTVCDYEPLEKEHRHSLKVSCAHFERDGVRVHLLDTPGYPDFHGRTQGVSRCGGAGPSARRLEAARRGRVNRE